MLEEVKRLVKVDGGRSGARVPELRWSQYQGSLQGFGAAGEGQGPGASLTITADIPHMFAFCSSSDV